MPPKDAIAKSPPKPGYQSSEFYLVLTSNLIAAFLASGLLPDTHVAVKIAAFAASALSSLGYSAARAYVKAR